MAVASGGTYVGKILKFYPDGDSYVNASGEYTCDVFQIRLDDSHEDIEAQVCVKSGTERKKYQDNEPIHFKVKSLKGMRYTIDIIKDASHTQVNQPTGQSSKPVVSVGNTAKSVACSALSSAVTLFRSLDQPPFLDDMDIAARVLLIADRFEEWINKRG